METGVRMAFRQEAGQGSCGGSGLSVLIWKTGLRKMRIRRKIGVRNTQAPIRSSRLQVPGRQTP